jgi:hypothetical protein
VSGLLENWMTQEPVGSSVDISIQEGKVAIVLSLCSEFCVGMNGVHIVQEADESSELFMKFAATDGLLLLSQSTSEFFIASWPLHFSASTASSVNI